MAPAYLRPNASILENYKLMHEAFSRLIFPIDANVVLDAILGCQVEGCNKRLHPSKSTYLQVPMLKFLCMQIFDC